MRTTRDFFLAAYYALTFHVHRYGRNWIAFLCVVAFVVGAYVLLFAPPQGFVPGTVVVIPQGATAVETASILDTAHVVQHGSVLRLILRITGEANYIHPGAYRFDLPDDAFRVAERVSSGAFGIPPTRITFVEGETVRDMAAQVAQAFPEISASDFIGIAGPYEGYLFPDTYLFPPDATAKSITTAMRKNFDEKTADLADAIAASGHTGREIVVMASLVEKEARTEGSKKMVAGILWNRIDKGMPLQVDAVFGYIFGRDTYSPSFEDLSVDSPYNTYTHKGLPPGPIDNPGIVSIRAAVSPTKSDYLYYITGTDNQMHYAKTYQGQIANQREYLK